MIQSPTIDLNAANNGYLDCCTRSGWLLRNSIRRGGGREPRDVSTNVRDVYCIKRLQKLPLQNALITHKNTEL